jgi:hypothetical protein
VGELFRVTDLLFMCFICPVCLLQADILSLFTLLLFLFNLYHSKIPPLFLFVSTLLHSTKDAYDKGQK